MADSPGVLVDTLGGVPPLEEVLEASVGAGAAGDTFYSQESQGYPPAADLAAGKKRGRPDSVESEQVSGAFAAAAAFVNSDDDEDISPPLKRLRGGDTPPVEQDSDPDDGLSATQIRLLEALALSESVARHESSPLDSFPDREEQQGDAELAEGVRERRGELIQAVSDFSAVSQAECQRLMLDHDQFSPRNAIDSILSKMLRSSPERSPSAEPRWDSEEISRVMEMGQFSEVDAIRALRIRDELVCLRTSGTSNEVPPSSAAREPLDVVRLIRTLSQRLSALSGVKRSSVETGADDEFELPEAPAGDIQGQSESRKRRRKEVDGDAESLEDGS
jgi:hypothetical protein